MTEAVKQPEISGTDSTTDPATTQTPLTVEEVQKQLEVIKQAQQGSDRKVSLLEKERQKLLADLEEAKTKGMTAEDKLNYEKELQANKAKEYESELKSLKRENLKKDFMLKNGVNPQFSRYLTGDTEEELSQNAKDLIDGIQAEAEKMVKDKLAKTPPAAGSTASNNKSMLYTEFMLLDAKQRASFMSDGGVIRTA